MRIYRIVRYGKDKRDEGALIAAHNFQDACRVAGPSVISCDEVGKLVNTDIGAMRGFVDCIEQLGEEVKHLKPLKRHVPIRCIFKNKLLDQCIEDALPSSNFCFDHQKERP